MLAYLLALLNVSALFLLTPILLIHFQSVSVSRQIFLYASSNTKIPPTTMRFILCF